MSRSMLEPRKTPRQARSRATRDAIVTGATQVLSASGMDGFNTNAVAERAGASIGTLYQYFPNREALMLALIHQQKQKMLGHLAAAMVQGSGESLEGAVRVLMRARVKHFRDDGLVAAIIAEQEIRLPIHDVRDWYLGQGGDLFARGLARWNGIGSNVDPKRAAKTVPAMVQGIMQSWACDTPERLEQAEQEAVRAVLGYLR